jgi:RNA polymerase sigma-70 factor (ECF subfamily)
MTVTDQLRAQGADAAPEPVAAFEALFLAHWPRVYGVLVRLLGDPAEAEDLALETFWRLYQRPPRERTASGAGGLSGWLYRVALNLGYNALRAGKRRSAYEEAAGREALERDVQLDPESVVEQAQERRRVREVLSRLAARDAQLLVLRHSGLSYKELAAALNVAPASIGTLLARAEAEFEKRWQETP